MDKESLKRYRKLLSEVELLKRQLEKMEPEYVMDSVNGSDSEFPYTNHKMHIEGYDLETYRKRVSRLNRRIINKMNELVEEKDSLIEFIYKLEDSEVRQIFIYKYIDGIVPPAAAPKAAPPAENSIPFGSNINASPTPITTLPICSNICEIPDGVIFCSPWKKPLKIVIIETTIGANEIPIKA